MGTRESLPPPHELRIEWIVLIEKNPRKYGIACPPAFSKKKKGMS